MTQVKINDLTLASNITSNMQLETDISGTTANKINISQMTSYFGSNITYFSPSQTIFVAKNGNDSTGDGSFDKPFLTIAAANAAITTASTSNRILVNIAEGTYNETSLKLKPWVYYHGQGTGTRINSSDNTWALSATGWDSSSRAMIREVTLNASTGLSFDFTPFSNSSGVIEIIQVYANGDFVMKGRSLGADFLQLNDSYCLGNIALSNCQGYLRDFFAGGDLTVDTANNAGHSIFDVQSGSFVNGSVVSTGGTASTLSLNGCRIDGTLTSDGSSATLNIDAVSTPTNVSDLITANSATINRKTGSFAINYLNATASLNFGTVNANTTSDLTISVTGAQVGDVVALGAPSVAAGIVFMAFVSATNTVTVRAANITTGNINLSSANFTVKIV